MPTAPDIAALSAEMIAAGAFFHQRGWVPATGGNFSVRLPDARMLITASGWHKGELRPEAFVITDTATGTPEQPGIKASYETLLHGRLYERYADIGCVLHTHSVANTLLSQSRAEVILQDYELLKIFEGISTHASVVQVPVFANDQDIGRLADAIDAHLARGPRPPAYLLAGHGVYVWGRDVAQTRHRVEALEFMLECELRRTEKRT